ncbi:MAG: sulfatase-like hydrolase/transferase, partial [Desulfobacterales bacterium]|nr:sulfatase-like hydrolase/transferase [Desulfobacterales bacterium]
RLMAALDEQKLRDETLVLFTSDNGPAITSYHPHGSAGPLRDKKGSLYEGGIRVPGILRWPGHTRPGTISDEPVCGVDLLPTLCAVAGIEPPGDRVLDGANLLPILEDKPVIRSTPLYWHFNQAIGDPKVALRVGDWKLLATLNAAALSRSNDITEAAEQQFKTAGLDRFFLYNLKADIGETTDLAAAEPAKLAELKGLLEAKYREVRNEAPTWPAWKFTGAEGRKIVWPDYAKKPAAK